MGRSREYSEEQIEEIAFWKEKLAGTKLYRKIEVLDFSAKGLKNAEIARLTDYSLSRVSDFVSEYFVNGIGYFTEEHRKGGNHRNISAQEEEEVLAPFAKSAEEGNVVSLEEIKRAYDEKCGETTPLSTFYAMLARRNWPISKPGKQQSVEPEDNESTKN